MQKKYDECNGRESRSAESQLLKAYEKSLVSLLILKKGENSNPPSTDGKYGFHYYDKLPDYLDEEEEEGEAEEDAFDLHACPTNCCDKDCECDDCVRCSNTGLVEEDSMIFHGVAG